MNEENTKGYTIVDRRGQKAVVLEGGETNEDMFQPLRDLEARAIGTSSGIAVELNPVKVEPPKPEEVRKANRHERRMLKKQSRQDAKRMDKKRLNVKAKLPEADTSPLDPTSFIAEVTNNLNVCVSANAAALNRIPPASRMDMQGFAVMAQLAFMLGYLDAYGPKDKESKLQMIAAAQDFRSKFTFRTSTGAIVKPQEEPLIKTAGPLIIPG